MAKEVGLDEKQFLTDFYHPDTMSDLKHDLAYTRANGVSGFPSIVMYGKNKPSMIVRGVRQFYEYSDALSEFIDLNPKEINYTLKEVFNHYPLLSTREVSELMNVYFSEDMIKDLEKLEEEKYIRKIKVNKGYYWQKR